MRPGSDQRLVRIPAALAAVLLVAACATPFSPGHVRAEIARQTGSDPERVFELTLGALTTRLAVSAVGGVTGGGLPLAGLTGFELALYDTPVRGGTERPPLDFTLMPVRGWEPTVRVRDERHSAVVLIRSGAATISDMVLVASDGDRAIYARLRGALSRELPEALGEAVRSGGTEGVRRQLMSLTESPE